MKFQKLNDDVFECYISQDELIAQGIDVKDFIADREKANNFLRFVLKEANFEIGFNPEGKILNVQISVMKDGALSLMISNENNPRIQDILGDLKSRLEHYQKIVEDYLRESPDKSRSLKPENIEDYLNHVIKKYDQGHMDIRDKTFNDLDNEAYEAYHDDSGEEETENGDVLPDSSDYNPADNDPSASEVSRKVIWAASFRDLDTLLNAVKNSDSEETVSDLYKYENKYYLYIHEEDFDELHMKLLMRFEEYSEEFRLNSLDPYPVVSEHGVCLIKGNALKKLLSL
jgi:negative regulator of genetic competence, sporulation and motility